MKPATPINLVSIICTALLLSLPTALHAAAPDVIAITLSSKGPTELAHRDSSWTPLTFGAVIYDSDKIRTGEEGFAAIAFTDDGSQLKMRPNSQITLYGQRQPDNSLVKRVRLEVGELFNDVKRQKGSIQILTPTSVASVKGTQFWVLVDQEGNTTLITLDGLVELRSLLSGQSVDVGPGYSAYANRAGEVTVSQYPADQPLPQWDEPVEPVPDVPQQSDETPDEEPGETEDVPDQPEPEAEGEVDRSGGGRGPGISMNGAVGAAVIEGKTYQFFSLRPDLHIGKWGVGLDLSLYFDADGNLREEDWDEGSDIVDKIYYLRYGLPGDPLFARAGSLDNVTLGFGLIMRRYSNAIEWPQVKRIGLHTGGHTKQIGWEFLINNFRELQHPGLLGLRGTYEFNPIIPMVAGATAVYDGNLYLGAKDFDKDGVPNNFDQFPGRNDADHIEYLLGVLDPEQVAQLINSGDLPDILNPPPNIGSLKENISIWGVDLGVPIIRSKKLNLWGYVQMAQIADFGRGYSVPGLSFNFGPFRAGAEYRIFEQEFMPEFFNLGYEVERVIWSESAGDYLTKKDRIRGAPSASGYYADAGFTFSNLLDVYAAYQNMSFSDSTGTASTNQSIFAKASVNATPIPKLGLAEAYYQQPQAKNLFDLDADGTTIGYRLGFEMAPGLLIVYDNKSIYLNGRATRIMTIETVFRF